MPCDRRDLSFTSWLQIPRALHGILAAVATEPIPTTEAAPTTELVTSVAGDRCANCHTPLAPDQRYCVNCGERRGRPRFSNETLAAQAAPKSADASVPPRRPSRVSSATTLVAGVATLLVAMGVGVLIGHYSNSSTPQRAADQIITVGGGANTGAASTPTGAAAAATGAATSTGHHKAVHAKATVVHVTQKTVKAANAAASKVLGGSASKNISGNLQQQVGGSCSGGAGCQNGRFTGNFFPGG